MKRPDHLFRRVLFRFLFPFCIPSVALAATTDLETGFRQPPQAAKPRTLWMWMNGNVTADGITRDLEAMRRAGLGGALIFNIGEFIPKGPIDYGRQPWIDLMVHAARESDRLGLELAMHNCPGWSSSGGPWITPEMSMQRLVWSETRVGGGTRLDLTLPAPFQRLGFYRDIAVIAFPSLPGEAVPFRDSIASVRNARGPVEKTLITDGNLDTVVQASPQDPIVMEFAEPFAAQAVTVLYASGGATLGFLLESSDDGERFTPVVRMTPVTPRAIEDAGHTAGFEPVRARFYRITPNRSRAVCEIELHAAPRIPGWYFKANHAYQPARNDGPPPAVADDAVIRKEQVIDLTDHMDAQGRLGWNAPTGNWTIVRFGYTPRGQENIAAPDAGIGLECDKMSRKATAFHFEHGLGPLLRALGPLAGKSFTALEVDSYEVGVQNWTAGFEDDFKAANGYDILPFLPAMTGRYVESASISERFLWDLRRTQAQKVADCYYGELTALANRHGMRTLAEPYGAGPGAYDELQIAGRVDIPMGEFWAHFPWDDMMSIRLAASATHVNGRSIVAGEAFTATEEQSRFLDHPFGLKTTGDLAFSLGLNQMYFHRFAHQPHPSARPGMTMGPWGFNFDRNNPWFDVSSGWLAFLARSQFLLQQGAFVADVLYFTGEGSPRPSKKIVPDLPGNFQFDTVDAEVLLQRARVEHGRIVLPGGSSYRLLALPPDLTSMTPTVLAKLRDLVSAGAMLNGRRPRFSPTLRDIPGGDAAFQKMVDDLWPTRSETGPVRLGSGRVFPNQSISETLRELNVRIDFEYTARNPDAALVWLHRRADNAEIYFVANRQRRPEEVLCSFRVVGRQPEIWRPETGSVEHVAVYDYTRGLTRVPLHLKPAESVFVVFRSPSAGHATSVDHNGSRLIHTDPASLRRDRAPAVPAAAVSNTFTLTAWIHPETDMMAMPQENGIVAENGKSWIIPAGDGSHLHGEGRASLGIAAGRNGVIVAERTNNTAKATLVSRTPLSGWTHLAVVCRDGKPSLYLNGKLDREGVASGATVHPGIGAPPAPGRAIYYFDGEMTSPELSDRALSAEEISSRAAQGLRAPALPEGIELQRTSKGTIAANVWSRGKFTLNDRRQVEVRNIPEPITVSAPWKLALPSGTGLLELTLPELVPLQQHDNPDVRFFAGTAIYRSTFSVPANVIGNSHRHWLDLGRLSAIAEVRLNGTPLGLLWTSPYRVEVTKALRPGENEIEVHITTRLANRLIGDEALPPEYEYDSRTRAILRLPDWYAQGKPKPPGGRSTFSTWRFFKADDPLVEAGLRGPVRVLTSVAAEFE